MITNKEILEQGNKKMVQKKIETVNTKISIFKKIRFRSHITLGMFLGLILNFGFFLYTFNATDIWSLKISSVVWWFGWFVILMFESGMPKEIKEPFKPSRLSIIKDLITPLEAIENLELLTDEEKSAILKNGIAQIVETWALLRENIGLKKDEK